jgi:hypothetical protein
MDERALRRASLAALGGATAWGEMWLDATKWWAGALADGARAWPEANGRLLAELAEGVARRFRGRRIDIEVGGRQVRAILDSIRVERRDDRYGARVQLSDVDWDGLLFEQLSIVATAVALTPPPSVAVMASGLELEGRSSLAPLVAWLDRGLPQWDLAVAENGLIEADRPRGARRYLLEQVVVDGELDVELRGVRWGSVPLRLPAWLRVTRKVPLPALPEGVSISEARRHGADIDLRVSVSAISRRLEPGFLREVL